MSRGKWPFPTWPIPSSARMACLVFLYSQPPTVCSCCGQALSVCCGTFSPGKCSKLVAFQLRCSCTAQAEGLPPTSHCCQSGLPVGQNCPVFFTGLVLSSGSKGNQLLGTLDFTASFLLWSTGQGQVCPQTYDSVGAKWGPTTLTVTLCSCLPSSFRSASL